MVKAGAIADKDGVIYPQEFLESLRNTPSNIGDMVCEDVARAWKTLKKHPVPTFKKKALSRLSFTIHRKTDTTFKLDSENVMSCVGGVSLKLRARYITQASDIARITISKSSQGWYASILTKVEKVKFFQEKTGASVGIDWGVRTFASDSDGQSFSFKEDTGYANYIRLDRRLRLLQSILGKKRHTNKEWRSSKRYAKLKLKIGVIYEKLANIRKDFIHHVSKYYVANYDTICIEDLKPHNMLKNHKLARAISQAMFYAWKVILGYKCDRAGKILTLKNPRNTSQTCSHCKNVLTVKLRLSERMFVCNSCGYSEDRDINAAKNILAV